MKPLKILIIEDDPSFGTELEMLVENIGYTPIPSIDNSAEALEAIYSESPDLILMDINIKGKLNGLQIAEKIKDLNIPVLFITSYQDQKTYQTSKEIGAIGFLVKPLDQISLRTSIEIVIRSLIGNENTPDEEERKDFLFNESYFVKKGNVFRKVPVKDVLFIKSEGNYCLLQTESEKFMVRGSLSHLESIFPENQFIQIHRSTLIQYREIEGVQLTESLVRIKGNELPIGRKYKEGLLEKLNFLS